MILHVENLTKKFVSKKMIKTAVDNISFSINYGEIVGLLGSNGAGKSTTIKMLCGLILPDKGTIKIFNLNNNNPKNLKYILSKSSFLLEGQRNLYYNLSLINNIKYFLSLKGILYKNIKNHIENLIAFFNMEGYEDKLVSDFSTGMKQKVSVILALSGNEEFIVLDEPTLGLDVHSANNMVNMLHKYVKKHNKTVLITSHNMNIIDSLCDRVIIMDNGKIIANDRIKSLKNLFEMTHLTLTINTIDENILKRLNDKFKLQIINNEDGTKTINFFIINTNIYEIFKIFYDNNIKIISIKSDNSDFENSYIKIMKK